MKASTLIGGKSTSFLRNEADFYPTPSDCTKAVLSAFPFLYTRGTVWEPACGDGAIARVIEGLNGTVIGTDLHDRGYGTSGVDFLTTDSIEGFTSIVTNPPFFLAEDFIRTASEYRVPFAMLLKVTYWNSKRRLKLFRETGPHAVCPLTWRPSFCKERGKSPTLDFIWTVWLDLPCTETQFVPLKHP